MGERVWYPTARVQIILRVDTLDDIDAFRGDNGTNISRIALSTGDKEAALLKNRKNMDDTISAKDITPPDLFSKSISALRVERDEIYAAAETGSEKSLESDPSVVRFWVIPQKVSIERNNLSDADKCTIELDYRSLPFDPRAFRFAAVRVVIGSASPEDYADGIRSGKGQNELASIVPPETTSWFSLTGNSRFVGFVDEWSVEFSDKGETVSLDCRDLSSVLRDEELPLSAGIDLDKPIRVAVEEVVRKFKSMQDVRVVYGNPVFPLQYSKIIDKMEGIPGPIPRGSIENLTGDFTIEDRALQLQLSKEGFTAKVDGKPVVILPNVADGLVDEDIVKAASAAKAEKKKSNNNFATKNRTDKSVKLWEHIADVCLKMALLPIMRGNILFIASPRDVLNGLYGRRQMIWGGNIQTLRLARKAGSSDAIGKTVQITSMDARTGREVWARYPVKPGEPNSGILGKAGSPQPVNTRSVQANQSSEPEDKIITYQISGISSPERLAEIAESVFHRVARQEVEVSIETEDLSSFADQVNDPNFLFPEGFDAVESTDLLAIQSGDSVIIETLRTASSTQARILNEGGAYRPNNFLDISAMSYGERVDFMGKIGFNKDVAQLLAGGIEFGDIQRTFRVNHASISWDTERGVSISIDAINFIEARLDKFLGVEADAAFGSVSKKGSALSAGTSVLDGILT